MEDYLAYDLQDEFTVGDIGVACTLINPNTCDSVKADLIIGALLTDIQNGKLIPTPETSKATNKRHIKIRRNELEKWFESKGQKPPFLFPEARNTESGTKPRFNQIEKAACQHEGKGTVPIVEPDKQDDWFNVINDAIKLFENDKGHTPNKSELWVFLVKNPPSFYGVVYDEIEKALCIPGFSELDRHNFNKRYARYYPPSTGNNADKGQ